MRKTHRVVSSILLLVLLPFAAVADTVKIPAGTTVYCVLDQDISTKKKLSSFVQEGDRVRALVMEDVLVDGHVVIEAGAVVWSKVSKAKRAKVAGIRGKLEVEATTVNAVDGSGVNLYGGYDRSGKGRIALAAALSAVVAWPLIFIKGKQAFLDRGVVFDAQTAIPIDIEVESTRGAPVLRVDDPGFQVEIMYDAIDTTKKIRTLPILLLDAPDGESAYVVAVNGKDIPRIEVPLAEDIGQVDFKGLSKHFRQGMNEFTVSVGEESADVLLEIEL